MIVGESEGRLWRLSYKPPSLSGAKTCPCLSRHPDLQDWARRVLERRLQPTCRPGMCRLLLIVKPRQVRGDKVFNPSAAGLVDDSLCGT